MEKRKITIMSTTTTIIMITTKPTTDIITPMGRGMGGHHHATPGHIADLIGSMDLPEEVKRHARAVYDEIARAEAKAHGCPVSDVHFHEVGALDAVADVTGGVLCHVSDRSGEDPRFTGSCGKRYCTLCSRHHAGARTCDGEYSGGSPGLRRIRQR